MMLLCALQAYNSPGHGKHAFRLIIDWAQELLETACDEISQRHCALTNAEKRLKVGREGSEGGIQGQEPCMYDFISIFHCISYVVHFQDAMGGRPESPRFQRESALSR